MSWLLREVWRTVYEETENEHGEDFVLWSLLIALGSSSASGGGDEATCDKIPKNVKLDS